MDPITTDDAFLRSLEMLVNKEGTHHPHTKKDERNIKNTWYHAVTSDIVENNYKNFTLPFLNMLDDYIKFRLRSSDGYDLIGLFYSICFLLKNNPLFFSDETHDAKFPLWNGTTWVYRQDDSAGVSFCPTPYELYFLFLCNLYSYSKNLLSRYTWLREFLFVCDQASLTGNYRIDNILYTELFDNKKYDKYRANYQIDSAGYFILSNTTITDDTSLGNMNDFLRRKSPFVDNTRYIGDIVDIVEPKKTKRLSHSAVPKVEKVPNPNPAGKTPHKSIKSVTVKQPSCQYGSLCYRQHNIKHITDFHHPPDDQTGDDNMSDDETSSGGNRRRKTTHKRKKCKNIKTKRRQKTPKLKKKTNKKKRKSEKYKMNKEI